LPPETGCPGEASTGSLTFYGLTPGSCLSGDATQEGCHDDRYGGPSNFPDLFFYVQFPDHSEVQVTVTFDLALAVPPISDPWPDLSGLDDTANESETPGTARVDVLYMSSGQQSDSQGSPGWEATSGVVKLTATTGTMDVTAPVASTDTGDVAEPLRVVGTWPLPASCS